jgi:hypothetical protein
MPGDDAAGRSPPGMLAGLYAYFFALFVRISR